MLSEHGKDGIMILAGGTDIIPPMRAGVISPNYLLDITALGLDGISRDAQLLHIGAACTFKSIYSDALCMRYFPCLCKAARSVGAVQTRNLATIGGNICAAVPSLDSAPALLTYDAVFSLLSSTGERTVRAADFFIRPRQTALLPGEILTEISLPLPKGGFRADFMKFGRRNALSLAIVNAAAGYALNDGRIGGARIAIGACAPVPIRAYAAEKAIDGKLPAEIDESALRLAIDGAIHPITDVRAGAEYRRELAFALVRKIIHAIAAGDGI